MPSKFHQKAIEVAGKRYSMHVLFVFAFVESIFFPLPPDMLLIPMVLDRRARNSERRSLAWIHIALICTIGSVCGGVAAYFIGQFLMASVGQHIIDAFHLTEEFNVLAGKYSEKGELFLFFAGFTPIPYKLFTIFSGMVGFNLAAFVLVGFLARGLRFFLLAFLIHWFGPSIHRFLIRYFGLTCLAVSLLIIVIYVLIPDV